MGHRIQSHSVSLNHGEFALRGALGSVATPATMQLGEWISELEGMGQSIEEVSRLLEEHPDWNFEGDPQGQEISDLFNEFIRTFLEVCSNVELRDAVFGKNAPYLKELLKVYISGLEIYEEGIRIDAEALATMLQTLKAGNTVDINEFVKVVKSYEEGDPESSNYVSLNLKDRQAFNIPGFILNPVQVQALQSGDRFVVRQPVLVGRPDQRELAWGRIPSFLRPPPLGGIPGRAGFRQNPQGNFLLRNEKVDVSRFIPQLAEDWSVLYLIPSFAPGVRVFHASKTIGSVAAAVNSAARAVLSSGRALVQTATSLTITLPGFYEMLGSSGQRKLEGI